MKEIIELNKRLNKQLGNCFSEGALLLRRNAEPEELECLPVKWREEIQALQELINKAMPDDFNYTLCLGDDCPDLTIEYADGPQVQFFRGHPWQPEKSVVEQLKQFDWDAERQLAISHCKQYDEMLAGAKDAPSRLPSTKDIQKAFRDEMKEFIKVKRKDVSRVYALLWRDDEGVREEHFDNLEAFAWDLINMMPTGYLVITVVADGKPLPVERIERLKQRALKELESMPLSHARALGKL